LTHIGAGDTFAGPRALGGVVKHFNRFDILFFLICTLVGVDTIGAVAADGPEAFFWLMALGLFFFLPYALLTAELGSAFTEEGGCYIWTKMAFGRFVACVNSVLYWLSNPVWVGGLLAIEAFQATNDFFFQMDPGSFWQYAFSLIFIWFGIWAAILSFGWANGSPPSAPGRACSCSPSSRSRPSCTASSMA
jgi:glutamate:GABA antiporter